MPAILTLSRQLAVPLFPCPARDNDKEKKEKEKGRADVRGFFSPWALRHNRPH